MVEHSSTSSEKTKDNVETYDPESYEGIYISLTFG